MTRGKGHLWVAIVKESLCEEVTFAWDMDGKKRGILQRSREEGPSEREEPEQSTWDRTKLAWFKGPKEASMAGAAPGRKRETRGEIDPLKFYRKPNILNPLNIFNSGPGFGAT